MALLTVLLSDLLKLMKCQIKLLVLPWEPASPSGEPCEGDGAR